MNISDLIPEILALVRQQKDSKSAYRTLLDLCATAQPSPLWEKMAAVDVARDIAEASDWLSKELGNRPNTTGVYLGLDTLNMREGDGHNVEIGGSPKADPWVTDLEWMYSNAWYGENHLIRGLCEMHAVYSDQKALYSLADYVLFLGYSGIILSAAILRLDPRVRSGPMGRLYAWGFHDGDIFPLCRATAKETTILSVES